MLDTAIATLEATPIADTQVQSAAREIDFTDPTLTVSYGAKTMTEIAQFTDSLLSNVKAKDAGPVGENLSELMLKVKGINIEQIARHEKSFLESLPIIGSLFNSIDRTMAQFNTLSEQVEIISNKLDEAMVGLLKDIEVLEQLYGHNTNFYKDLTAYIEAGDLRLAEARKTDLPKLEEEAKQSGDALAAQKVRDFADRLNRFERRLHDLKLSRTVTMQTAPQIRMIQSNNQTLAEKIQTSILSTIPIWKNQMVLALSIHGQQKAVQLQKDVADTTNQLLSKNAEMLKTATVDTAREVERSIVDIETLRDVHNKLISTIEETMAIAQQGRERRRETEKELESMEEDLRVRLTDLATRNTTQIIEGAKDTPALTNDTTIQK